MTEKIFDSIAYFKQLAAECRTCRDYNFVATECSGPDSIQGVMQQFRKASNFIMVSDTVDSNTHSIGEGFFDRNVYTVWILAGYRLQLQRPEQLWRKGGENEYLQIYLPTVPQPHAIRQEP